MTASVMEHVVLASLYKSSIKIHSGADCAVLMLALSSGMSLQQAVMQLLVTQVIYHSKLLSNHCCYL